MTIRAIDLQVLIPRVTEVSKVQHIADQQVAAQQQQVAAQQQQAVALRQQQVQQTPQNAGAKVNPDGERGERRQEERHKEGRGQENEAEEKSAADPIRGHTIDIKT